MSAPDKRPRIYLHPDERCISVGFGYGPDTIVWLPDPKKAPGDHARAVEWAKAVSAALESVFGAEDPQP